MKINPVSIEKKPDLKPAQDYYHLRKEGISYIEQMGSRQWTDYNTHDPGITILEALCYAITDLAYRTGRDIKDMLSPESPSTGKNPFPDQPFFTAREILTVNPWTPNDFRRILIDLDGVRNGWIFCRECGCDGEYYAWCDEDKLNLSFEKPKKEGVQLLKVSPRGLYDVLLELESDPELGDLNNRKIEKSHTIFDGAGKPHVVNIEFRFPEWQTTPTDAWRLFVASPENFNFEKGKSFNLKLRQFGATKSYDVLTDPLLDDAGKDGYLRRHWRNIFYADFELELIPSHEKIRIENVAIRFNGDNEAKNKSTVAEIRKRLEETGSGGVIRLYRSKMLKIAEVVNMTKSILYGHRNLDEDFCRIKGISIEDIAVCADVEVAADADIEWVQARIWFEIEQYFNPPVPFYSLQELMAEKMAVEEIFSGPELSNGFIKAADLENGALKKVLRTSDIVNLLMEIEGVIAVNNLLLTKYDEEGGIAKGAADPVWVNGKPVFDANKSGASWLLYVKEMHQPRLYPNFSRFLFYKNGLPFQPRMDEVKDTLTQLRGEAERPKFSGAQNDLPVQGGQFPNTEDYFPVQYTLPATYGVGPAGLPSQVTARRKGAAKQLKAYLLIFEQLLGNAFAQIAHLPELFSLNPNVGNTYFVKEFSEELISGYLEITNGLDKARLQGMTELQSEFQERRNRFLNHLLARFGEQFSEYALMLTNLQGKSVAADHLIDDKISFLKKYPVISHDRARAFDFKQQYCNPANISGLEKRITLLLGYPDLTFEWRFTGSSGYFTVGFSLTDTNTKVWLAGSLKVTATTEELAKTAAYKQIINSMVQEDAWEIVAKDDQFYLILKEDTGNPFGEYPQHFTTKTDALDVMNELSGWSANEKAFVVEHLLLRPKFPGDALYPACNYGSCKTCGDEDPYSFRLTYVMPGWIAPFNANLDMRRFADRTIRQELPSHLLGKICWVGNDGFIENPCDPVISDITGLVMNKGITSGGERPSEKEACGCAFSLYTLFSNTFSTWYEDKTLTWWNPDVLKTVLEKLLSSLKPSDITCSLTMNKDLWKEITSLMVGYFSDIVVNGWQFERFEDAWCQWLKENDAIDWTEERLHENVEAILNANLAAELPATVKYNCCACASQAIHAFGISFNKWMIRNIAAGRDLKNFTSFKSPKILLCPGIPYLAGTAEKVEAFLLDKYRSYKKVSYSLRKVVHLLSQLKNSYPGATMHDCDDGSDQHPVRLGNTVLGSNGVRRNLTL